MVNIFQVDANKVKDFFSFLYMIDTLYRVFLEATRWLNDHPRLSRSSYSYLYYKEG